MNRNLYLSILLALFSKSSATAETIQIEPPFWWSGMKNPELQLMVYGTNISGYSPEIDYPGIRITRTVTLDNPNYLLLYLDLAGTKPGNFNITFRRGEASIFYPYELKKRKKNASAVKGFDSSDVIYLIMPDRFAKGNPGDDAIPMRTPYKVDRKDPGARHGGDLAGIESHLDYIEDLGVTALWLTPVLENDMEGHSYHGYAITDFYKVDARFGTNDDYLRLIKKAHRKGLRVIMDMVFNHCGSSHPWVQEIPCHDWFNNPDHYVQTNHDKEVFFDPYASKYDLDTMTDGWFVQSMPDLNQKNPHVARYLIQNSVWWIEYAGINGIRQDTYPYADVDMMREWCMEVMNEYPDFNIVGEAWMNHTIGSAFWQRGSRLNKGKNTHLKSVMDFRLLNIAGKAFHEETTWAGGLHTLFEHLCYDFVYPDIYNVLRFLENHDTDRFLPGMPENLDAFKQAITFLLTIPGIPQLYYGQELLMNGSKENGDGYIRRDFPGGWAEDEKNQFEASGRTDIQNEAWSFMQKLLKWRKGNDIIARGKMKHFMVNQSVYVYERHLNRKSVVIMMNGSSREVSLPLNRYAEILHRKKKGRDIITGKTVHLTQPVELLPKDILILEL